MNIKFLQPLYKKIKNILFRAFLTELSDSEDVQVIKVSADGGIISNIQRIQNYGCTSNPPKKSQVLVLSVGGNKENCISPSVDYGKERPKNLKEGEVQYWSIFGHKIKFSENGVLEIETKDGSAIHLNGGNKSFVTYAELDSALQGLTNFINSHTHPYSQGTTLVTAPSFSLDISSSKTEKVFTGG